MSRNPQGRWLPGASGNPGGRPRGAVRRIRSLCQDAAEAVIHEMIGLALDPTQRARDRISAANIILDRGLGKASSEMPDDDDEPVDLKTRVLRLISPEMRLHLGLSTNSRPSLSISESVDESS
jgi:hypothetical protein